MRLAIYFLALTVCVIAKAQAPFSLGDRAFKTSTSPLRDKLIAYWRFEESNGMRFDCSSKQNNLTSQSNTLSTVGKVGNCAAFLAGNTNSLSIADNASLSVGDSDFSMSAWFKLTHTGTNSAIFSKRDGPAPGGTWNLIYVGSSNKVAFAVYGASGLSVGTVFADSFGALSSNTWYHVWAAHDASSNMVYICMNNGTVDSVATTGPAVDDATLVRIGAQDTISANRFTGSIDEVGLWGRVHRANERGWLFNSNNGSTFPKFSSVGFPTIDWDWGTNAITGPYTLATTQNRTVVTPSGSTPSEGDLLSHRFRHCTRIAHLAGITFVAYSSGGSDEEAGGQQTAMSYSTDKGTNWSSPILVVPSQSTFEVVGTCELTNALVSYPRGFEEYGGNLYLISAVDRMHGLAASVYGFEGVALLGCKVNSNGTIGNLFLVSTNAYGGYAYDNTLSSPLMTLTKVYGKWGGSFPGVSPETEWINGFSQDGNVYMEPTTFSADGGTNNLYRFWRRFQNPTYKLWWSTSNNGGVSWSRLVQTPIPDENTSTTALRLSDGRYITIGNPVDVTTIRDPLYLAVFSGNRTVESVSAIRQGVTDVATYPAFCKSGAATYAGAVQVGNYLYVSYSLQKETIGFSRVLIPGLADNDNDT